MKELKKVKNKIVLTEARLNAIKEIADQLTEKFVSEAPGPTDVKTVNNYLILHRFACNHLAFLSPVIITIEDYARYVSQKAGAETIDKAWYIADFFSYYAPNSRFLLNLLLNPKELNPKNFPVCNMNTEVPSDPGYYSSKIAFTAEKIAVVLRKSIFFHLIFEKEVDEIKQIKGDISSIDFGKKELSKEDASIFRCYSFLFQYLFNNRKLIYGDRKMERISNSKPTIIKGV